MKIDFYYWGMQCPLIHEMLNLFHEFKDDFQITLCNIASNADMACRQKMFFPFLTVVDNTKRFFSPVTRQFFLKLKRGEAIVEKPFVLPLGREIYKGEVVPLTWDNMPLAGKCTGQECAMGCMQKADFLKNYVDGIFGFLHTEGSELLGGVEYVPTTLVPYDIPKDDTTAFITCVYLSSSEYDYKALPLQAMEAFLKKHYSKVYAISDEHGVFPNGDLMWFLDQGYRDEGVISTEQDYCILHLVSKQL